MCQGRDAHRHSGPVVGVGACPRVGSVADAGAPRLALGAVLTGYGAGILPWLASLDRQMYYFYAVPLAPFLVMGVTLVLGEVLGQRHASPERRTTGLLVVCLYVGLVVANFVWLWPILTGLPITVGHWHNELWLPSWR